MLPLLVAAGGLGLGAAAFFGLKSRCKTCESIFTLNESCLVCGEDVCGDCGLESPKIEHSGWPVSPKGRVCKNHLTHLTDKIETFKKAIDRSEKVQVFSKNYKGAIPDPALNHRIETQVHADRDDAEREMRILAALLGATAVVEVEFHREKREDGNYKYSVWKCSGRV